METKEIVNNSCALLIDSARHFLREGSVLTLIARAAAAGITKIYWHLSDDQGYRAESEQFPMLQEMGGRRGEAHFAGLPEEGPSEGFYTKKQMKRIAKFAAEHGVTLLPEIELPGHATAMIAAYPELGCSGFAVPVADREGEFPYLLCAGRDETVLFASMVLKELADLFPAGAVSIGAGEFLAGTWDDCPYCHMKKLATGYDDRALFADYRARVRAALEAQGVTVYERTKEEEILYLWTERVPNGEAAEARLEELLRQKEGLDVFRKVFGGN